MRKAFTLPVAIVVLTLPAASNAQSQPLTVAPPPPPPVVMAPPPPLPPRSPLVRPGEPANDPRTWFVLKDYPKGAMKRGEQGRVRALMTVNHKGRTIACEITVSSGFAELDAATCAFATKRARFVPQLGVTGKPEPFKWPVSMRWMLGG